MAHGSVKGVHTQESLLKPSKKKEDSRVEKEGLAVSRNLDKLGLWGFHSLAHKLVKFLFFNLSAGGLGY